ncbi:MAG: zinc-binding dehydrogenase, partial [Bdellovibrionales bacterium]|nr:zinc-binding dehydrogenase [Bdellovibrionales bacterium]
QTLVVVGIGFLGALLVQLCTNAGASVVALSRRKYSREIAERYGATVGLPLSAEGVASAMQSSSGSHGFDCVIEATGKASALEHATALTKVRGRLVIAGYHQDGPRTIDMQQWNWKGLDVINAHERAPEAYLDGIAEAVRMTVAGELEVQSLLTHVVPLEALSVALDLLSERPDGFLKAVVCP